mgnify:CR=1 FL=1
MDSKEVDFEQAANKKIELNSYWIMPPDIVICDRVATVGRVKTALRFWEQLGYEFGEIREAVEAMGAAIQVAQAKINNTTYVLEPVGPIEDELHVLDLIRIGIEISEKENEAEFEAAKEGNHNYERCYSERPDWLFDD